MGLLMMGLGVGRVRRRGATGQHGWAELGIRGLNGCYRVGGKGGLFASFAQDNVVSVLGLDGLWGPLANLGGTGMECVVRKGWQE